MLSLAQRLFWGRLLCGAKSKELDLGSPAAGLGTQTAFDFLRAASAGVFIPKYSNVARKSLSNLMLNFVTYLRATRSGIKTSD
jgi:hypothetical protein